jgi:cytochrome c-type biogenesis protein CcmH
VFVTLADARKLRVPLAWSVAALLTLLGAIPAAFAVDPTDLGDPALQARYEALTHELRCVQCQAESIADSPVDIAADMRRVVAQMLKAGKSDQDVRDFMTARYGDYILFKPRSLLLWAMPGVLLAIGAAVAWRIVSQRRTLLATDSEPVEDDA